MSEETSLPKYAVTESVYDANELYDVGYRLHTVIPLSSEDGCTWGMYYIMSLREPTKYDNIDLFKKIEITYDEKKVPDGWRTIHHTSKELIVVKDHEPNDES